MVQKKQFIDPKTSVKFALVHRSQRDLRIADDEASEYVLKQIPPSVNLQRKGLNNELDSRDMQAINKQLGYVSEEEEDEDDGGLVAYDGFDARQDPSNFGVYFKDQEYDYMQHLKPMGEDASAVFVDAKPKEKPTQQGIRFVNDQDASVLDSATKRKPITLPSSVFGSSEDLEIGLMNQPEHSIDPKLREIMAALDDEEYVEDDLEDDFFDAMHLDAMPEKYIPLEQAQIAKELAEQENADDEPWMREFKKFQQNQSALSDDDYDSDDASAATPRVARSRGARTATSSFSMSSSAMFRNDKLTLLDDQFDKILEEYSDEEIGELDPEDEDVLGSAVSALDNRGNTLEDQRLEEICDEFLENLTLLGQNKRVVTRDPSQNLDALRTELKEDARTVLSKYEFVSEFDPDADAPELRMPEPKQREQWDCETVLSNYTNIYNRPQLIAEISKGAPKIKFKKGMPSVVSETIDEESDAESEEELGVARQRGETKEEKKARKALVKSERRERRATKKATTSAFKNEEERQSTMVPNHRLQKKTVHIQ